MPNSGPGDGGAIVAVGLLLGLAYALWVIGTLIWHGLRAVLGIG